jgi:lysophospholipase L1-like esterase
MKKATKLILYCIYLLVVVLVLLEVGLRIYNPLEVRISNGKIQLKKNSIAEVTNLVTLDLLDDTIVQKHNELGFRGDRIDEFKQAKYRLLTIGGSTTECAFLDETKTWPSQLKLLLTDRTKEKVSVMNAGLDGHSSFGHLVFLEQFKDILKALHPTHILVMAGINDLGIVEQRSWDEKPLIAPRKFHSVIFDLIDIYRSRDVVYGNRTSTERVLNFKNHPMLDEERRQERLNYYQNTQIKDVLESILRRDGFYDRMETIAHKIKDLGAKPIFVSQAAIYGPGYDESEGIDFRYLDLNDWSGETRWLALSEYNKALKTLSERNNWIAYAAVGENVAKLRKYFYDEVHLTNEGAQEVAGLVNYYLKDL